MDFLELRVSQMEQKLDMLITLVQKVADEDSLRLINIEEYAKMLGISKFTLYKKKWLLPNFGRTNGKSEWTKAELVAWMAKGTEKLYNEYIEFCKKEMAQS